MQKHYRINPVYINLIGVICLVLGVLLTSPVKAQDSSIEHIEREYKNHFGLDKLKSLNDLSQYYYKKNSRKALRYGRQAVMLSNNIFVQSDTTVYFIKRHHQARAYLLLGKVLFDREDYFDSQENLKIAKTLSLKYNNKVYKDEADIYLEKIRVLIASDGIKESFFSKTLGSLKLGEAVSKGINDIAIQTEIKLGMVRENLSDFKGAIYHYEKVVNLLRNRGSAKKIKKFQLKIAILLDTLDEHVQAQKFLNEAIMDIEKNNTDDSSSLKKKSLFNPLVIETVPIDTLPESLHEDHNKLDNLKKLAADYALEKDFKKSLVYERMYRELFRKIKVDSLRIVAENKQTESEILLLMQQKRIADLNVNNIKKEKERQIKYRNILILIAILILFSTLIIYYFYSAKKREHEKLTITHIDLEKTKSKLVDAEQKIVTLLKQQLSGDIAQELLQKDISNIGERCFVSIMFLDIRDFTSMAEKLSPEELIAYQNEMFGFMIDAVQKYHGNINQFLGDGFMATFGAPVSHGNDCENAFLAAKQILAELKIRNEAVIVPKTKIGIGLHAGNVVTGNVGNESRKQYSVTGNPVIIASRVEQLNKEYKSQLIITEEIYHHLKEQYVPGKSFLTVNVKGRTESIKILTFN